MDSKKTLTPEISVILLTRNGMPVLQETLAAVLSQSVARPFEVLAIDSGSTDGTRELLSQSPVRLESIPPSEFNFGTTRGRGYDRAQGEILVALSQDAVPADDRWLEKLTAPFKDAGVAGVRGGQDTRADASLFYWERVGRFYFTRSTVRWRQRYGFTFSNVNSAIRKKVWEQNRIGAVEMCEDKLLQKLWMGRGLRFISASDARVYHSHQYDLRRLTARCENEGLGERLCGERYSLADALGDSLNLENWRWWVLGLRRGEIRTPAELLFPLVRPLFLWKGNRFTSKYVRASA